MIDTLPPSQVEQRALPRTQEDKSKRTGSSAGIFAICILLAVVCAYLAAKVYSKNAALAEDRAQQAQSNFRNEQTQASLDAATVRASALEAQITLNQNQKADLQAQAAQAKAHAAGLEAQVSTDKGQISNIQGQLDQTKAQLAAAQSQLAGAAQESSALRNQLEQAKAQAADMQAQVARNQSELTKLHPLIVEARRLPLVLSFEKSFWDQRFTLHINNPGNATLRLRITISGQDTTRAQVTDIEGGATLNVPSLPSGEKVAISSAGFDTLNLTAR
jgi:DNA repair exonuclease SbcCD ATPase subunit